MLAELVGGCAGFNITVFDVLFDDFINSNHYGEPHMKGRGKF